MAKIQAKKCTHPLKIDDMMQTKATLRHISPWALAAATRTSLVEQSTKVIIKDQSSTTKNQYTDQWKDLNTGIDWGWLIIKDKSKRYWEENSWWTVWWKNSLPNISWFPSYSPSRILFPISLWLPSYSPSQILFSISLALLILAWWTVWRKPRDTGERISEGLYDGRQTR